MSNSPNYWVPRGVIESATDSNTATTSRPAEAVITALHDLISPLLPLDWAGAEYWVQIYNGGRGLAFHFDKDEHIMSSEGRMVNPIFSSVFYLSHTSGPPQAPTVVTNQRFDVDQGCVVPDDPTSSTLVFPRKNSYCIFDGALGHGVLDSGRQDVRVTLLVNWWKKRPENIERMMAVPIDDDGVGGTNGKKEENEAVAVGLEQEHPPPECIFPESIRVLPCELGEEGMLLVDDLMRIRGKNLIIGGEQGDDDDDAVHAVTIHHDNLALYPLDNEQLIENQGEIVVGAAVLPCIVDDDLSSNSSSSSSSKGEWD